MGGVLAEKQGVEEPRHEVVEDIRVALQVLADHDDNWFVAVLIEEEIGGQVIDGTRTTCINQKLCRT